MHYLLSHLIVLHILKKTEKARQFLLLLRLIYSYFGRTKPFAKISQSKNCFGMLLDIYIEKLFLMQVI